jgi:hypothetical protein
MTDSATQAPRDETGFSVPKTQGVTISLYPAQLAILAARQRELEKSASEIIRELVDLEGQTGNLARVLQKRLAVKVITIHNKKRK